MKLDTKKGHVVIENVRPQVDCGLFRAKAVVGDVVEVTAEIFRDGPAVIKAVVRYRGPRDAKWQESPLEHLGNDEWAGSFRPTEIGRWSYQVEAWTDHFATWRRGFMKKVEAGQDVRLEIEEGARLLEARLKKVPAKQRGPIKAAIEIARTEPKARRGRPGDRAQWNDARVEALLDEGVGVLVSRYPDRTGSTQSKPVFELTVDRERARFGAWYEFFPRSTGKPGKHGTFKTAAKHLPVIADMGFDVVYLPPIHPIGTTFRKGKNNTLDAGPDDVGSPWAIGSEEGGHDAVNPKLGTIDDFDAFVAAAERAGIEVALDFAIQCSPDHPWVKEHPDWFTMRPDGSIQYAENPPKKYQDIYPINFDTPDKEGLWTELKRIVDFWIGHGVKIFRVDNPHTKAFAFWHWLIDSVQEEHPDVIFLSEAFTRPKVMRRLAKLGFTQSYTYFTWRNTKWELEEYLTELTQTELADYFRPNFFANTPDILHEYLQQGGPPAFKIRLVLASMLSPTYGIYSGYELFENKPLQQGSEEYLHSEKYELRHRDLSVEGSLVPYVKRINDIRRKHTALSELTNLRFHYVDNDNVMAFSKTSRDGDPILVVVNLNPVHWAEATVHLDLEALGIDPAHPFRVHDLISDQTYLWHGSHNYVRLDPFQEPAHVFRVER
ncbi:MAG TPA: alpha-1,4-glucan--maltose-1-phosphate maltosyltransferase [Actinomycetota bacterium]|nr:alpha-1,4-glucan--maltose-1-phosphate maltosyltransferase [Actinomycetota bacterium]